MLGYVFDLSAAAQLAVFLAYGTAVFGPGFVLLDFPHANHPNFCRSSLLGKC